MIEVWHLRRDVVAERLYELAHASVEVQAELAGRLFASGGYDKVAEIDLNLDDALLFTDMPRWSVNPRHRASNIGDIFIEDGHKHVVALVGFNPVML